MPDTEFWIGSYTGDRGAGRGIYGAYRGPDGALVVSGLAVTASSPSFLATHPSRDVVYAVSEDTSRVAAFDVARTDGTERAGLHVRDSVAVPEGPCHVAVVGGGTQVIAASYLAGAVTAVSLAADGSLASAPRVVRGEGSGPHPRRQRSPHPHAVAEAPDGVLLCADLGADALVALRIDAESGAMLPVGNVPLPAGCGPRHLIVHANGYVYVLTELAQTVVVLRPRAGYDDLVIVSESPATATPAADGSQCAAIKAGADGRFLYTSTRGADVVTTHEVLGDGRELRAIADTPSGGTWPRDLHIDADRMFVVNERSHSIASFALDSVSGVPEPIGIPAGVPSPVCIVARR